eukprot:286550-Amphidinium_carterae.1
MARTKEAESAPEYRRANQGERPLWWPEDMKFFPGKQSRRPLWLSTEIWNYHSHRRETAPFEKEWQDQLKKWADEGKDIDAIYTPRPKPPSAKATKKVPVTSTPEVKLTNDD